MEHVRGTDSEEGDCGDPMSMVLRKYLEECNRWVIYYMSISTALSWMAVTPEDSQDGERLLTLY